MHIKHDRFMNDLDGIIEEAYFFDCKTIFDKYIEEEDQTTAGYMATKAALINAAEKLHPLVFALVFTIRSMISMNAFMVAE